MTDPRRLQAIYRMWEAAQVHGQPHDLATVVAFFDDSPMEEENVA